jgi:hypothetical protein
MLLNVTYTIGTICTYKVYTYLYVYKMNSSFWNIIYVIKHLEEYEVQPEQEGILHGSFSFAIDCNIGPISSPMPWLFSYSHLLAEYILLLLDSGFSYVCFGWGKGVEITAAGLSLGVKKSYMFLLSFLMPAITIIRALLGYLSRQQWKVRVTWIKATQSMSSNIIQPTSKLQNPPTRMSSETCLKISNFELS